MFCSKTEPGNKPALLSDKHSSPIWDLVHKDLEQLLKITIVKFIYKDNNETINLLVDNFTMSKKVSN